MASAPREGGVLAASSAMNDLRLGGWDLITALLGLTAMLFLLWAFPAVAGHKLLWIFLPALTVVARRQFLPQLSPRPNLVRPAGPTVHQALRYVMVILGGFLTLLCGLILLSAAGDGLANLRSLGGIAVIAVLGIGLVVLGIRRPG